MEVRVTVNLYLLFGGLFLCAPSAVAANSAEEQQIGRCINAASQGREWLEKTLWGLRDQEGGWVGAEVRNTDGTFDLGPLQVNSWWVPKMAARLGQPPQSVRYWLRYDACFNVEAARWIYLNALNETDNYWEAVGRYHSPTGWRQHRYARSVSVHLRRRYGPNVFR